MIDEWIEYGKSLADWYAAEQKHVMAAIGGAHTQDSGDSGPPPKKPPLPGGGNG